VQKLHVSLIGSALTTLVISILVAQAFVTIGLEGSPALVAMLIAVLFGGVVSARIARPVLGDVVAVVVVLTLLGWLWQYRYPSGEQSSTDWFARGGTVLIAVVFTSLWATGALAAHVAKRR